MWNLKSNIFFLQLALTCLMLSYTEAVAYRRDIGRSKSDVSIQPATLLRQFSTVEYEQQHSDSVPEQSYQTASYEPGPSRFRPRILQKFVPLEEVLSRFRVPKSSGYSRPSGQSQFQPISNPYIHRGEYKQSKPVPVYGPPKQSKYKSIQPYSTSVGKPSKLNDAYGPPENPEKYYNFPKLTEPGDNYGLPETPTQNENAYSSAPETEEKPQSEYGPPSSTYGPPVTTPSPNYGTPAPEYGPPSVSTDYGVPSQPAPENREIRFLIHKPGEEEEVKNAVIEDAKHTGDKISFIKGPEMDIHHKQKVYLPPPKKTIIYILLKEPTIKTTVQVMDPKPEEMPKPEVFIIYENPDGVIKRHYDLSPEEGQKVAEVLGDKIRSARDSPLKISSSSTTTATPVEITVSTSTSSSVINTSSSTHNAKDKTDKSKEKV